LYLDRSGPIASPPLARLPVISIVRLSRHADLSSHLFFG
jgi:hypothetical protein